MVTIASLCLVGASWVLLVAARDDLAELGLIDLNLRLPLVPMETFADSDGRVDQLFEDSLGTLGVAVIVPLKVRAMTVKVPARQATGSAVRGFKEFVTRYPEQPDHAIQERQQEGDRELNASWKHWGDISGRVQTM